MPVSVCSAPGGCTMCAYTYYFTFNTNGIICLPCNVTDANCIRCN